MQSAVEVAAFPPTLTGVAQSQRGQLISFCCTDFLVVVILQPTNNNYTRWTTLVNVRPVDVFIYCLLLPFSVARSAKSELQESSHTNECFGVGDNAVDDDADVCRCFGLINRLLW